MTGGIRSRDRSPFASWIAGQLAEHGWSYRDLVERFRAAGASLSPNAITQWMSDRSLPQPRQVQLLAAITRTPVDDVAKLVWESALIHDRRRREQRDYLESLRGRRSGGAAEPAEEEQEQRIGRLVEQGILKIGKPNSPEAYRPGDLHLPAEVVDQTLNETRGER